MKHEAHGTQQPRPIDKIGEGASTMQRSDSLNQHFLETIKSYLARLLVMALRPQGYVRCHYCNEKYYFP